MKCADCEICCNNPNYRPWWGYCNHETGNVSTLEKAARNLFPEYIETALTEIQIEPKKLGDYFEPSPNTVIYPLELSDKHRNPLTSLFNLIMDLVMWLSPPTSIS